MNGEPPKSETPFFIENPLPFERPRESYIIMMCPDCGRGLIPDLMKTSNKAYCWVCDKEFAFNLKP